MQLRSALIALGLVGAMGAAAPAKADSIRFGNGDASVSIHFDGRGHGRWHRHESRRHDRLSPREVRRILRHRGFHDISRPDFRPRRGVYVAFAEGRRFRDVRVVVDAFTGRILGVDRVRRGGPRPRWRGHH